jgi:hypothetical protein
MTVNSEGIDKAVPGGVKEPSSSTADTKEDAAAAISESKTPVSQQTKEMSLSPAKFQHDPAEVLDQATHKLPNSAPNGYIGAPVFVTVSAQLSSKLENTNTLILPPKIVAVIEQRVRESYAAIEKSKSETNSRVEGGESLPVSQVFSMTVISSDDGRKKMDDQPSTVEMTLMGLKEYVTMGQKLIDHFVRQAQIMHNINALADMKDKAKCVRFDVPLDVSLLASDLKIMDLEEVYVGGGKVSLCVVLS